MESPILDFSTKLIKKVEDTVLILPTLGAMRCFRKALGSDQNIKQSQVVADAIPLYNIEGLSILSPCLGQGAVYASLPPLLKKGAKRVILIGFAGALPNSNTVIAEAISANGFYSKNLIEKDQLQQMHIKLSELLTKKSKTIFTTDTPYSESAENVLEISKHSSIIEMEAYAAHQVCKEFDVEFSAHFVISDVWGEKWNNAAGSLTPFQELENLFLKLLSIKDFSV